MQRSHTHKIFRGPDFPSPPAQSKNHGVELEEGENFAQIVIEVGERLVEEGPRLLAIRELVGPGRRIYRSAALIALDARRRYARRREDASEAVLAAAVEKCPFRAYCDFSDATGGDEKHLLRGVIRRSGRETRTTKHAPHEIVVLDGDALEARAIGGRRRQVVQKLGGNGERVGRVERKHGYDILFVPHRAITKRARCGRLAT